MPEHLHFLLVAHSDVVSKSGKPTHLGHVIAGFKYGCNKRYWAMAGIITDSSETLATESPATVKAPAAPSAPTVLADSPALSAPTVLADSPGKSNTVLGDSVAKKKLPPLFEAGYCDIMPLSAEQLATQRAYIRANPRSRLMRTMNQSWLYPQRRTVNTAVSLRALHTYLQRECPRQLTDEALSSLQKRLLQASGLIVCDSYGNVKLLNCRLLLLTPWNYQYRTHEESISVPFCKTMNCIAQAVCKLKDDWWKKE